MPYTGTPRTWVAGAVVTAAQMNSDVRDPFTALAGAWTSYTPTLAATGTALSLGTAPTQVGQYIQVGKFVVFSFYIAWGTTPTLGTGTYRLNVPVSLKADVGYRIGSCDFLHSGSKATADIVVASTSACQISYPLTWPSGTLTEPGPAAPWAWAAGDVVRGFAIAQAQ